MKKLILFLIGLLGLLFIPLAFAAPIRLKHDHPIKYTVKQGDTLWSISSRFLDDPLQWPLLLSTNPHIDNPSKIYPGEVLVLSMLNGEPHLSIHAGGTVKLSPKVRSTPIDNAIPTIPLDAIKPFLDNTRVISEQELRYAPYIVAHHGEHIVTGAGNQIYVEGINPHTHITTFSIFRPGKLYVDPHTKENLGFEAIYIGETQMVRPGQPATLLITETKREVLVRDRLLPTDNNQAESDYTLHIPTDFIDGEIISVMDGVSQVGQYQVVVVDRGARDGLQVGDVLAVFSLGKNINNPNPASRQRTIQLPNERSGELMIFKTFPKVSYALILHAVHPLHVLDKVSNTIA